MRRLGRYELLRSLGVGGQGHVYEAVLRGPGGLRRSVALKVLARGDGLRREGRMGGLLRHPHLVDVYEVGEDGGTWFCAMELCPGGTLSRHAPLSPRAVVEVGLQVCKALQYAHDELGLVHLDLKPDNLLLAGATVKVADLGVARAAGFDSGGRPGGTPQYMAPEQAHGGAVDARADIYALGVTLRELATGVRPALSSQTWTPEEALFDEGIGTSDAQAPDWLAPVLARCLAPDPDDRYPSMGELAAALTALNVDGPSLAELLLDPEPERSRQATNLEPDVDAFVGRGPDRARIRALLEAPALITLRGAAGIGKTRLARHVARAWREETGGQAWFCDVSGARTLYALLHAVAAALDVPLGKGDDDALVAQLGHAIAGRGAAIVVLDNFEQAVALAPVVGRWRELGRDARLLVTSREALRLPGEVLFEVEPLDPADARALLEARAADRGVDLSLDPAADALARRLDGVPLALELAAGRLGVLTAGEVVERLGLSGLRSGRSDVPDRQVTLRAALDWSWDLLDPGARRGLARLSVFAGGISPEAAEAVGALAGIDALVEGSLLRYDREKGRYSLLGPVREYAASRLSAEEGEVAERAHGAWFSGFGRAERLDALDGPDGAALREALADEVDNLVVACRRAIARGDERVAAACAMAAGEVFDVRGPLFDGAQLLGAAGAIATEASVQARLLRMEGRLLHYAGRGAEAERCYERALAVCDPRAQGPVLAHMALLRAAQGRLDEGRALYESALAKLRAAGDRAGEGLACTNLGNVLRAQGRVDEARAVYLQAQAIHREVGNRRAQGILSGNLAVLEWEQGRADAARAAFAAALLLTREVGDRRSEAVGLGNLGNLYLQQGLLDEARAAYEAALAIHREVGNRRFEGLVVGNVGILYAEKGRMDEAKAAWQAALAIHRETGDVANEGGVLGNLGSQLRREGRFDEARACYEAALAIHRATGSRRMEGVVRGALGEMERLSGSLDRAAELLEAADALLREVGDRIELAVVSCARARIALARGDAASYRARLAEARSDALAAGMGPASELGRLVDCVASEGS